MAITTIKFTSFMMMLNYITISSAFQPSSLNINKSSSLHMNFFKDMMEKAFENDTTLSSNKAEQQLEGPNDTDDFNIFASNEKTDVQKRWLESQKKPTATATATTSKDNVKGYGYGAPMNPSLLHNTKWKISFYLTGVPDFDPSNSLYGSKVNISTRSANPLASKDGFAIGADNLPEEPSVEVMVQLAEDGRCIILEPYTDFTTFGDDIDDDIDVSKIEGQWKLSDDQRIIRFSIHVTGYQRTVTTKGTIQNVYWSDREESERKTSATYSIKPGFIISEAEVGYGDLPGVYVMAKSSGKVAGTKSGIPEGLVKVEKKMGVLGAASKMLPCGKFSAEMIVDEE